MSLISKYIKKHIKDMLSFVYRNLITLSIIAISIYFLTPTIEIIRTLLFIALFEGAALMLSGISLFAFTKFKFTSYFAIGDDNKYTTLERTHVLRFAGMIFLAVHILCGFAVLGVYLAQIQ